MPDADFRFSVQHRSQWISLPAPYTTTSLTGDFQALRNKYQTNWLGFGFALYNDNVGDGKLSLFRSDIALAYHIQIGNFHMISFGGRFGNAQRSVNFSKFSYPIQWDGYSFNRNEPNKENKGLEKSFYNSLSTGLSYAYFPNETIYIKMGVGVDNLNLPKETFFDGGVNYLERRYTANIDALFKTSNTVIFNPSAYISTQSKAQEVIFGSLIFVNVTQATDDMPATQIIFGVFNRIEDAVIGAVGLKRNGFTFMSSYDYTISKLPVNAGKGTGALELSLKYENLYGERSRSRQLYHCPRF